MQLTREFNRVMGKDIITSIKEKWMKIVSKIISTAEEESEDVARFTSLKEESGMHAMDL